MAQGRQELVFRRAEVDEARVERVQAAVQQRVLGLFERRGMLSSETVGVMQGWGHRGGFSVHAGERVAAQDSAGRERLLRFCARPMFAVERLVWVGEGAQVRYRLPWSGLQAHRVGQQRPIELRQILAHAGEPTTAPATRNQATRALRPRTGQRPGAVDFVGYLRALWYRVETLAPDFRRTDGLPGTSAGADIKHSPTVHIILRSDPHSSRDIRCQN